MRKSKCGSHLWLVAYLIGIRWSSLTSKWEWMHCRVVQRDKWPPSYSSNKGAQTLFNFKLDHAKLYFLRDLHARNISSLLLVNPDISQRNRQSHFRWWSVTLFNQSEVDLELGGTSFSQSLHWWTSAKYSIYTMLVVVGRLSSLCIIELVQSLGSRHVHR